MKPVFRFGVHLGMLLTAGLSGCSPAVRSTPGATETPVSRLIESTAVPPTETPQATVEIATSDTPVEQREPTLFLATANADQRYGTLLILFQPETTEATSAHLDLSSLGWDVGFGLSRFNYLNGTERVHYQPSTEEVVFVLSPLPGGIGGLKPPDALPEPPYRFAVYRTEYDSPDTFEELFRSTESDDYPDHTVLNSARNSLLLELRQPGRTVRTEIWELGLNTAIMTPLLVPDELPETRALIETSDLRISPDGRNLYQLLLFGTPGRWTDQVLYLMSFDLESHDVDQEQIATGDAFAFGMQAFSAETLTAAYYTGPNQARQLWVTSTGQSEATSRIPTGQIGNVGLYLSPDGNNLLIGLETGWVVYDRASSSFHHTPLERPFGWDQSSRYLAGAIADGIVVYDIETMKVLEVPMGIAYGVQSAQWP